jgi:HK97 family phage major capsid protein
MSTDNRDRSAAEIFEEKTALSADVLKVKNDLMASVDQEEQSTKIEELNSLTGRLEALELAHAKAAALENAAKMIESLQRQPVRATPSVHAGTVKYDTRTGTIVGGTGKVGFDDGRDDEARQSYEYSKAFSAFLKAKGDIHAIEDSGLRNVLEKHGKGDGFQFDEFYIPFRKDMTLGTTTNGSNAVPPDFRNDIITQRTIVPVMSSLVRVINTTSTRVTYPRNSDASATDQVGTGYAATKGETPNVTLSQKDTGPFTQLNIDINTGTMWTAVTLDFLDDIPNAQAYIVQEGMKAFAAAFDNETINGVTGSGQAEGVISCTTVNVTKTGVNNTLVTDKIVDAAYRFRSQYAMNQAWVMARPTHGKLINLKDSTNRSLFLPFETGYMAGTRPSMLSMPIYYNEYTPASGTSLPKSVIVGEWDEYILAMRSGVSVTVDTTSWRRYNMAIITWRYRFGGAVRDPRAFCILHESA